MAISIKPRSGRPGHAVVAIDEALPSAHFHFTIRRQAGDGRFVGADGRWHPVPQNLSPLDFKRQGTVALFELGPAVVNTVNEEELVVLEIPDARLVFDLIWPALPRSASSPGVRDPFGVPTSAQAPVDVPELVAPRDVTDSAVVQPQSAAVVPESTATVIESRHRRRRPWIVVASIGALTLIAGGAYVFYAGKPEPEPRPATVPNSAGSTDDSARLSLEAKELIASRGDVGKLADLGQRLLESASQDAQKVGLAALFAASSRGSAVAQLSLGKAYDPRYVRPESGPVREADAALAADRYAEANQSGLTAGGDELRGLCSWLRQRAASDQGIPQPCANE